MSLWKRASCSASAAIWYASSLVGLMMRMVIWPEAGGRCLSCRAAGIHSKSVQQSCLRHSSPVTPVRSAVMFTYGYCRQSDGGTHVEISETQVPLQVDSLHYTDQVGKTKAHHFYCWNQEGQGLASSRLGLADDVHARQAHGQGSRLDIGAGLVAEYL